MGFFSFNYFQQLKRPEVYLAYPNKKTIGALHASDLQTDIMANSANSGSFKIYRYENGEQARFYDEISTGKYIHLYGIGWYRINEISVVNEGINESKDITILSLECELGQTMLTSFGSLGTEEDDQGGLDRYCLYNPLDAEHSIIHIFLQKNPGWSVKYIDPQISAEYRNFQEDSADSYSFLTGKVSEVFECIFTFDSYDRSVSAYKLEHLGKDTGITLNYRNVIKSTKMDSSENDVKTVLTVTGGNDERTNTPLGIADVNIAGTNQILNVNYYLPMMSPDLQNGLKRYRQQCNANEEAYQKKMSSLLSLYDQLNTLKNKIPEEGDVSTLWSEYGLRGLEEKELIYKTNISLYLDSSESELYKKNAAIHAAIEAEIHVRKKQIARKEGDIETVTSQIRALIVDIKQVLGVELYNELGPYIREDTLVDDSFIATNSMTDGEILEMQQALLEHGRKELERVSYPQFTMELDLINFTVDYDYKRFTDSLEMFNIIHINFEDHDSILPARLLKLHVNWDDPSDFKATFSNRNSLKETWALIEELRKQTADVSSKVEFATGAWKNAAVISVDVNKYMNSILDMSKQQLVTNENNEVKIDSTGILCRKWLPEQGIYDPCQVWITANQIAITHTNWNSVGLALGYVKMGNDYFFGLCADSMVGRLIIGEQLIISNESGTYTFDKNGFIAKNGIYQVKINPDIPSEIFSVSIDNKKLLYVDAGAKALTFEGKLISKSGQIASFNIAENALTSGNIGLSSDKTSGAVAFWAGNTNKNNAPFRVTNTGALTCSNAVITGGSLKVGDNFSVSASGILKAREADISGKITATSGKIAGWNIEHDTLIGTSGKSYIKGGEINIGNGFFRVYEEEITLGDFEIKPAENDGRGTFMSYDQYSGLTSRAASGNFCIWAGFSGGNGKDPKNYAMCVNTGGQLYARDIIITDSWWEEWSITKTLKQVYKRLQDVEEIVNNLTSE